MTARSWQLLKLRARSGFATPPPMAYDGTTRPPYAIGPSIACANFDPIDVYPIRSPLIVADFLLPYVRNRTFVEIGTQSGDISACLRAHAKRVIAVERYRRTCKKLMARGIEVVCEEVKAETVKAALAKNRTLVPMADVYYWWLHPGDNKGVLTQVTSALEREKRSATIFFGMDPHTDPFKQFSNHVELLRSRGGYRVKGSANMTRLFFDETVGDGLYPNSSENLGLQATYTTPLSNRPGRWGVFHVFQVDVDARVFRRGGLLPLRPS